MIDARPLGSDITAAGIIRASAAIIAQIGAQAEARLTERLQLGARNGPRWTSMTSPMSGGQARRVNFSLPLLRAFSVDWRPRWRRGRGHDDTRARPYPDPRANRADGRRPDRRDRKSPPTSPPLAPLLHQRRARKEDGPTRHRPSRTANRHAPEAQRSPRPKGSAQSAGSADRATQQSKSLLPCWQELP